MGQTRKWVLLSIYEHWALYFFFTLNYVFEATHLFLWFIEEEAEVQRGSVILQIAAKLGSNLA